MTTQTPDTVVSDSNAATSQSALSHRFLSPFRYLAIELRENLQLSAPVERLWLMGRMAVALVGIFAAAFVLNGTSSAPVIYVGGAVVLTVNIFLFYLLRQGKTRFVAITGLLLDNLVVLAVWTSSIGLSGGTRPTNDLYLGFFPVFVLWTSRLGLKLGIPYILLWMTWISLSVHIFMPAGSYEIEQLPIRIAFLTLTSMLGMWTARLLKSQMRIAQESSLRATALQDLDRAKDQFIATVSHELKTPMTAILGFARLLRTEIDHEPHVERLTIIERNGERLNLLIDDLLDLSRIQNESISLNLETIDAASLVTTTLADLSAVIDGRNQAMRTQIPRDACWIEGDSVRFAQVITNLVTNASKYSPDGSTITVTMSGRDADGLLSVVVRDQGAGIPVEDQASLFQPFHRTKAAFESSVPGTGLGLFISKRIVELHGGELTLVSGPGRGTTVEMRMQTTSARQPAKPVEEPTFSNAFEDMEDAV